MSKEQQTKEHKGRPGGSNKSEGTGLSSTMQNQDVKEDEKISEKYMKGTNKVADNVHVKHRNRNTGKEEPIDGSGFQD